MSDERSERLRRNRNRAKERVKNSVDEQGGSSTEPSEPEQSSKPEELSKPSEQSKLSVKDERVGTYMYLPESQQSELSRLYNVLKAEYEYEFDTEFEKNRHFYPLVIEFGIDGLEGSDASDVRTKLDSLDVE